MTYTKFKVAMTAFVLALCVISCEEDETVTPIESTVYLSSNTSGKISTFSFEGTENTAFDTLTSAGVDADGINYDNAADVLYQMNRSANVVNAYSNFSTTPTLTATSTPDVVNGRELTLSGTKLVVAQDAAPGNGDLNKYHVYDASGSSITLDKTLISDINLWGIQLDGNTMYAIEDNSSNLAIYNDFLGQAAGNITADKIISITGIIRTHGLTYDAANDVMVLTDVADAASGEDGAIIVIKDFSSLTDNTTIEAADYTRIAGAATLLGNPVDVAYNHDAGLIFVAERKNAGGQLLVFDADAEGNVAPVYSSTVAGASAIDIK